ncbi:cell division protein FtsB [Paraferrimonas sp. SM1919]|uniref:cell division protein FtsB n=1 Tax=Paraferrimonas sp. SM1919 TaxID=2662263 RepID=UPI0013D5BA2D|nr:cell division protein FtsB [Paraferrimonas sp. SM1919]
MNRLFLVLVIILGLLQYRLWFGKNSLSDSIAMGQQVYALEQGNVELELRNQALINEIQDLKDGLDAIEEKARNELGLVKEGETFYRVSRSK